MQSHFLIDNLRKSLYTRLYYALVDSDYLIKALTDDDIKIMLDAITGKKKKITTVIQGGHRQSDPIDYPNKEYLRLVEKIKETYPVPKNNKGLSADKDRDNRRAAMKELNKRLSEGVAKKYPLETLETTLIMEYLKENHAAENLDKVEEQVKEYREKLLDAKLQLQSQYIEEGRPAREAEEKRKKELSLAVQEKYKQFLQREKVQSEKDKKARPKSQKLVEEWMKDAARSDVGRYSNLLNLINLVGSLYKGDKNTILRLEKYLSEKSNVIPNTDKTKLKEILLQLQSEQKQSEKRLGRSTKITPDATQAKTEGIKVGKQSKIYKKHITVKYGGDETLKIKNTNYFIGFEKLDLRNPTWFNSTILRDIPMYWVNKSGFTKGLDKWEELSEDKKTEFIKKVAGQLPEYAKVRPLGILESLYRNVWERHYALEKPEDPENFAYFLQGLRDGIMESKGDTVANDFLRLQLFQQSTLPNLVRAIKSNIIVNTETGEIDFRLGPAFSKLMRKYKTMEERTEIIEDLIDIVKGKSLSNKYAGRNADELKAIEKNIIDIVSEKIEGETVLSYIISTFMEMYPASKILAKLLKDEDALVEVEYLRTAQSPSSLPTRPKQKKTKIEVLQDQEYIPGNEKDSRPSSPNQKAGKKTKEFVDREWDRYQNDVITEEDLQDKKYKDKKVGDKKYDLTDEEIHARVGWKKITKKVQQRTYGNTIVRDSKGKPKMVNEVVYEKYRPELYKKLEETKKSLDNLLVVLGEEDNIIVKEDVGIILESLKAKQRKKVKAILNIADPTEYFGHDFLKLSELVRVLKSLGVVKGDKKLNKKVLRLEDENLKVVKLATRLRKDYEKLYKELREMVYPKLGEEK